MTTTTAPKIYIRPGETILQVLKPFAGLCTRTDKPLVSVRATWGIYQHQSYGGQLETFPVNRHADGSVCITYSSYKPEGEIQSSCYAKPTCPDCGVIDQFNRRDTGYGWDVTCTACGVSPYYDSGD